MDTKDLIEAFEKRDAKIIEEMATLQTKTAGVVEQLADIEQKLARTDHSGGGPGEPVSLGKQFVEAEPVKSFLEARPSRGGIEMRFKASITSTTGGAAGAAGDLATPYRDGLVSLPQTPTRVRSLIPTINITQTSVEVPVQTARNLNAAPVAEGAPKPQSDIGFDLKDFPARVIAHWMKASKQILDDVGQLRGIIDNELLYGLSLAEDAQLLNGGGTGQNLHGLIPQATAYAAPIDPPDDPTYIDQIGLALLQNSLAEYPADGVVMHPANWMRIRLTKDKAGNYIYGPPSEAVTPRIFGVPVVPTQAMPTGTFLVGQFQVAAMLYDRWDARIEVGYVDDDFTRNLVTVLAEERIAFAVKRALALTYGTFAAGEP